VARFTCVVELVSKGLFSDHDTLVLKLVLVPDICTIVCNYCKMAERTKK